MQLLMLTGQRSSVCVFLTVTLHQVRVLQVFLGKVWNQAHQGLDPANLCGNTDIQTFES